MKTRAPCPCCRSHRERDLGGYIDVMDSGSYKEERREKWASSGGIIKDLKKQSMGMERQLGLEPISLRLAAEMSWSGGLNNNCVEHS